MALVFKYDTSSTSAPRGAWPWLLEKQQWRFIKCSLATWWNYQECPRKGKREILYVYSPPISYTASSSFANLLFLWQKFEMEEMLTLGLCLHIKPLECDDSSHLARMEASDGKYLCFVHWCVSSTVPDTWHALGKHVLEKLILNQVELSVCYMLGWRARGNEFWASLLLRVGKAKRGKKVLYEDRK